jgi:hypothetical protein
MLAAGDANEGLTIIDDGKSIVLSSTDTLTLAL